MAERECLIEDASIEDEGGGSDGAYDLLDEIGTPDEIGKAIADSLKECDLMGGPLMESEIEDRNGWLYLNIRIKVWRRPETKEA